MAAGNTYTPIATQTLGSAAASVTFSSISGAYTDLVLVCAVVSSTSADDIFLRFNGDTATNYSVTTLSGNGTSAISDRLTSQTNLRITRNGYTSATLPTNNIVSIQNYSNATTYKTTLIRSNNSAIGTDAIVGLWRATPAAITTVLVSMASGNFSIGSTFSLYGIASA
jgi:hypothetical protein